jgi:hypothetical protein
VEVTGKLIFVKLSAPTLLLESLGEKSQPFMVGVGECFTLPSKLSTSLPSIIEVNKTPK